MLNKKIIILSLFGILLLTSCRKDSDFVEDPIIEFPETEVVDNGALQGIVLDEVNEIIIDAQIQLFHFDMLIAETTSDSDGNFYLNDFAAIDEYTLSVTKDDYVSYVNNVSEEVLDGEQIEINLVSESFLTATGTIGMVDPQDSTLINLTGRIINNQGQPLAQSIALVFTEDYFFGNIAVTDQDGTFSVLVPKSQNIVMAILSNCLITFEPDLELGSFESDQYLGDLIYESSESFELYGMVTDCSGSPIDQGLISINYFGINGPVDEVIPVTDGSYSWQTSDCAASGLTLSYIDQTGVVSYQTWLSGLYEPITEFDIEVCDSIVGGSGVLIFTVDSSVYVMNDLRGLNTGYGIAVVSALTQEYVFGIPGPMIGETVTDAMILDVGFIAYFSIDEVTLNITQLPNSSNQNIIGTFTGEFVGASPAEPIIISGDFSIPVF